MAHLRRHSTTGILSSRSGAAAAALRLRAAAWDIQLTELPNQLGLWIWGCELRLVDDSDTLRLELSGPERRLVETLRDTATQMMGDAGLAIQWDRVDAGALAPGLSLATVVSVLDRSPGFLRMRLTGTQLDRFHHDSSLHFRLLIPPPGRAPVWPRVAPTGRTMWPEGADMPHRAVYTVSDFGGEGDAGWIDVDVFRHANSPTCDWLTAGPVGSTVGVLGPGGGGCPTAERLWLFGDETALPAISRILAAHGTAQAVLSAHPEDMGALSADARVSRTDDLMAALVAHPAARQPAPGASIWFAGHADQARAARAHLLAQGWAKADICCAAYWG